MSFIKYTTVISLILLLTSCSITKKVAKTVVGDWQIISLKSAGANNLSDGFTKTTSEMLNGAFIYFKEDKTYIISVMGRQQKGIWRISDDGKRILTSDKNRYFEIISLVENVLTLKSFKGDEVFIVVLKK